MNATHSVRPLLAARESLALRLGHTCRERDSVTIMNSLMVTSFELEKNGETGDCHKLC